jgi:hypothetical protein
VCVCVLVCVCVWVGVCETAHEIKFSCQVHNDSDDDVMT